MTKYYMVINNVHLDLHIDQGVVVVVNHIVHELLYRKVLIVHHQLLEFINPQLSVVRVRLAF